MSEPTDRLPLNALRVFEAVATHLSFTAAAKELGVTDRGHDRPSYRDMLGSPRPKNPAAVY